jgi:hypothetical protein
MATINRKRLAISAAFVAAIAYTIWNGSWAAFPLALSQFWQARWTHAEDKYFAERKTTRTEHTLKTIDSNFLADHWAFDKEVAQELKDGFFFSTEAGVRQAILDRCKWQAVIEGPEESMESYFVGLNIRASLAALGPWARDIVLSVFVSLLVAAIGPAVLSRYLRWLRSG